MNTRQKGFTLIELLVVIAIIGILASVVLASLNSAREKSRDVRRIADIGSIRLALELYFDANDAYPADLSTLGSSEFIASVPGDPLDSGSNSGEYWYSAPDSAASYHLAATLENTANMPEGDADCVSTTTGLTCFSAADTTNGFDGEDPDGAGDLRYDVRN